MKPLYLTPEKGARVVLEGPSLAVLQEGSAVRRYPLRLVARVIMGAGVEVQSEAVSACLQRGIPITFLARNGVAVGHGFPQRPQPGRMQERIERMLEKENWSALYQDWLRAAERREILDLLRRLNLQPPDLRPQTVRPLAEQAAAAGGLALERVRAGHNYLKSLLSALLAQCLHARGVRPAALAGLRPDFRLLPDLTRALSWRYYADLAEGIHTQGGSHWHRQLTERFEAKSERERARIRALWDRFCFWLGGLE